MPRTNSFVEILTRDEKEPQKDIVKVKKLAFIFNYFEQEMNLS